MAINYPTAPGSWFASQNYWDGYNGGLGAYYSKVFPTIEEAAKANWAIDMHFPGDSYVAWFPSFSAYTSRWNSGFNPDPAYVSKFPSSPLTPPAGQPVDSGFWMQSNAGVMTWYGNDGLLKIAYVAPPPVAPPASSSCVVQDMTSFGACVSDMSGSVVLAVLSIAAVMIVVAVARAGAGNVLAVIGFKK